MNRTGPTRQSGATDSKRAGELVEQAFSRHQDQLLGMLYYLVGNGEDAHDALQEAFIKCWRRLDSVAEVQNLRAWIFRIALNVGRDLRSSAWRRRRRPLAADESLPAAQGPSPEAELGARDQIELVRRAVLDLRTEEQEVFLLRQDGEMTYDQIAQVIGIPVGTVKTRMRLALAKLREAIPTGE